MNIDAIQDRLARLKSLLAECPEPIGMPEEVQRILRTAPNAIRVVESAINNNDCDMFTLRQIAEKLEKAETLILWAVGVTKGKADAEDIMADKTPDTTLPPDRRFNQRMTRFMATKINRPVYISLAKEFSGENSVQGDRITMEPQVEVEAFTQWMLHDKIIPGQSKCLLRLFADEMMDTLPPDELALLKGYLNDRPSIYQVVKIRRDKTTKEIKPIYLVQDLLCQNEIIRIRDRMTSRSLHQKSIFMGRLIPVDDKEDRLYYLRGAVNEFPPKLWALLSPELERWRTDYFRDHPDSTPVDFFRAHNARLNRKMVELVYG